MNWRALGPVVAGLVLAGCSQGPPSRSAEPVAGPVHTFAAPTVTFVPETVAPTTGSVIAVPTTTGPAPSLATAPLAGLRVDDSRLHDTDYRRITFGNGWLYDPATGCDTRERVLIDESAVPVTPGGGRCHTIAGGWYSPYDGSTITDPARLEVDHVVALSNAWRSGAWAWGDARRIQFANDLTDPDHLLAVDGSTNQSKSDSSPDGWMPPDPSDWCRYATVWVEIKLRWELSVTTPELASLGRTLGGC